MDNIKFRFDSYHLKIITCVMTFIGNFGLVFLADKAEYLALFNTTQNIGMLSLPFLAFFIVQGFFHSSDLKKYIIRIAILAVISEIAFDFAIFKFNTEYIFMSTNVVFTLLIGLVTLYFYDKVQTKYRTEALKSMVFSVLILLAGCTVTILINSAYVFYGIIMILIMYIFRNNKLWMLIALFVQMTFLSDNIGFFQLLALPFIWLYSGEEGKKAQKVFYAFYPAHLIILGVAALFI